MRLPVRMRTKDKNILIAAGICLFLGQASARSASFIENTRDPFVSIIDLAKEEAKRTTKIDLPGVALRGIIYSDSKAVAIVNDELVMVGDNWSGYKVEAILKDRVVFNDGVRSYELVMQQKNLDAEQVEENKTEKITNEPKAQGLPEEGWQYGPPSQEIYRPDIPHSLERKE